MEYQIVFVIVTICNGIVVVKLFVYVRLPLFETHRVKMRFMFNTLWFNDNKNII